VAILAAAEIGCSQLFSTANFVPAVAALCAVTLKQIVRKLCGWQQPWGGR